MIKFSLFLRWLFFLAIFVFGCASMQVPTNEIKNEPLKAESKINEAISGERHNAKLPSYFPDQKPHIIEQSDILNLFESDSNDYFENSSGSGVLHIPDIIPGKVVSHDPSSVLITVYIGKNESMRGNGVIVSNNGYVITAFHLIEKNINKSPQRPVLVVHNNERYLASTEKVNQENDIALLKISFKVKKDGSYEKVENNFIPVKLAIFDFKKEEYDETYRITTRKLTEDTFKEYKGVLISFGGSLLNCKFHNLSEIKLSGSPIIYNDMVIGIIVGSKRTETTTILEDKARSKILSKSTEIEKINRGVPIIDFFKRLP